VVASSWVTIDWALARPPEAPLAELLAEEDELAPEPELVDVLLELLELQAASVTAAAIAPPEASRRFHLCVIALCLPSQASTWRV